MKLTIDGVIYQTQAKGGVSRIFNEILPRMCNLDGSLEIDLFTERGKLRQQPPTHPQIVHKTIPCVEQCLRPWSLWRNHFPAARRLLRRYYMGSGRGTIWHSTEFTAPTNWIGKQVVTFHDLIFHRYSHLFTEPEHQDRRNDMHRCFQTADLIIAVSENTSREIQDYYGTSAAKIRVIPNGYNQIFKVLNKNQITDASRISRPFLLYIGTRIHYKNFNGLLEAYGRWSKRDNIDLVIVGSPEWSTAEVTQLRRLGIYESVQLVGWVDDEQLAMLYNQACAFVYPSLAEGFGIPLLEAMACGCPILASRIPSTLEVAKDCPIYFEPKEIESLITALDTVFSQGRQSVNCTKGLELVKPYSWDRTARQTLAVYHELS